MKGLHHVGITVKDLDSSIRFYHDVLGLDFSNEPSPWFDDPGLGPAVGVPGAALRQVSLKLGDTTLELLQYRSPESDTQRPLLSNNIGASHVAFVVDDIVATKAELEGKGISFYSDVNVVDEGVLAGWRWVYFEDPDGYPLELVQVAYYNADERRAGIEAYLNATRSFEANT
jgi:catechol 2,3-dioxygenase-like lactoylglutathione lyase family enzyme